MTPLTPGALARRFLEELEVRMRKMGVITTAHYDCGQELLASVIRMDRENTVAEERERCVAHLRRWIFAQADDNPSLLFRATAECNDVLRAIIKDVTEDAGTPRH